VRDAGVRLGLLPLEQAGLFGPAHELGHRALRELHPLGELGDGRSLAPVRCAFHHQEQEVALRCQVGLAGDPLGAPQKLAQLGAELRHRTGLRGRHRRH
jgi:hypothetical protein